MSRTLILTLAAAATITVASFASSASYARGFSGGGHIGGGGHVECRWPHRCRWPYWRWPCWWPRRSERRPDRPPRLRRLPRLPRPWICRPSWLGLQSSRTLDIPWRPLDRRRPGGGRCGSGRGARGSGRGSRRQLRPVHLPDQDLHAGRPRDVRGRLHQGSGLGATRTEDADDVTFLLHRNQNRLRPYRRRFLIPQRIEASRQAGESSRSFFASDMLCGRRFCQRSPTATLVSARLRTFE